jgi:single-stranded-DNA-specific exonuclease
MNYRWKYEPPTAEEKEAAKKLTQEAGVSPTVSLMLIRRGINTPDAVKKYFRPQLQELLDPFLMDDMDVAVERLNDAIGRKERILIYGDYDVDGCTAVALVYRFLQQFYSNVDYYIPDRYEEGYGVSMQSIEYAKEHNVKLVIVLDCGIKAVSEIAYAKESGIDFIICDHHVPDEVMPPAVAILNAKRTDSSYPFKELSGCGVGFKFMQAFAINNSINFSRLIPLLDLCAVSIATDLVSMTGENRIMAFHGLKQINQRPSVGLKAVVDVCGLQGKELSMSDIIFKIGPRINASGRMQNGKESVSLLVEKNLKVARKKAETINRYNEERKELDKKMTEEAYAIVDQMNNSDDNSSIVIYNEEWHKGVIGIVASRLTELYFKPAIVLTKAGDVVTGSARSVGGFDVYSAIESCRDLLENFGGHTYAAGLSLKEENFAEFKRRFQMYVNEHIDDAQKGANINVDAIVSFRDISPRLICDLKRMRPFGPDNVKPVFCARQVYDYGTSKVVGRDQEHIKLELVDNSTNRVMNGIAFGQSSQVRYIKTKSSFEILFTIEDNTHKHGEIQLQIEDIKPTKE